MAINKNHEFEELDGVKCAIVEKNVSADRAVFLSDLLEYNGFKVVVAATPSPKVAPAPKTVAIADGETAPVATPPAPSTFTVGVTNVALNATNAVYGRMLQTRDGHVVTPAYWQQKESVSHDEIPYYEHG